MTSNKKTLSAVLALTAGLVVAATSAPAFANVTCVPTAINTDNLSRITIQCGGAWYNAQPGVCSATVESVKMMLSLSQAAMLAGKNIEIATSCSTHVVWMNMTR
jgi:hypothetical protein